MKEQVNQKIQRVVASVIQCVQTSFSLQKTSIDKQRKQLTELIALKRQLDLVHPARLKLQNAGYASIEALEITIANTENDKNNLEKSYQMRMDNMNREFSRLESIDSEYESLQRTEKKKIFESPSTRHLKSHGFGSIQKFKEAKLKLEACINTQNQQHPISMRDIERTICELRNIGNEFKAEISSESEFSKEGLQILQEKRLLFENYTTLKKEISDLQSIIKKAEKTGDLVFDNKLEATKAEKCLIFFKIGMDMLPNEYDKISEAKEELEKYIKLYFYYVEKVVVVNLSSILSD